MKQFFITMLLLSAGYLSSAQGRLNGRIIAERDSTPLPSATIRIKGTALGTSSNNDGYFSLDVSARTVVLEVFYIGYLRKEVTISMPLQQPLIIALEEDPGQLREVVVSTGYEQIPKERATGSFVQVDNALLNRRVSTDILTRLQDVVPGLIFNRDARSNTEPLSIRGRSTISSSSAPLIVIDNFPWEGDISTLNPNDVESITVLKDAAAASIWGARSGNGVIVINTKKGSYRQAPQISFNSNVNISDRPDVFYQPYMSTSEYIELEKKLFAEGFYKTTEASVLKAPLTPVVELLIAKRDGVLPAASVDSRIEFLKTIDVRNDYQKYLYRRGVNQQYSINLRGGSENQRYYVSGGLDRNLSTNIGNGYNRTSLNAGNTYAVFKNRLELTTSIYYTGSRNINNALNTSDLTVSSSQAFYPYAQLVASDGTFLTTAKSYRSAFAKDAVNAGLLNWEYSPLADAALNDESTNYSDYRVGTGLRYSWPKNLRAEVLYQYSTGTSDFRLLHDAESYYTRNMINNVSVVAGDGSVTRPIPLGGILDLTGAKYVSHDLRAQINYNRTWTKSSLAFLAGTELRDRNEASISSRLYGYDDDHATSGIVNYIETFPRYVSSTSQTTIPAGNSQSDLTDRFLSYYSNASYTFNSRYIISLSGRLDRSNLFGVSANQQGVPLFSVGAAWNLSEESFYKIAWLPYLKLRLTYGYNGNINKNVSAYTTTAYNNGNSTNTRQPYAIVDNPPNPELRWERVKIINSALDFSMFNDAVSGSVEYYRKTGIDLIGTSPFPPSSGISSFTGNYANTAGKGVDILLNVRNLNKEVKWTSAYLFSYNTDKVTKHSVKSAAFSYLENYGGPLEGKPIRAIYSYAWAGLDGQTGDPLGYVKGKVSKDYTALRNEATPDNLVYHGSARPLIFGAIRNTFSWKNISASANISYRFRYFFRPNSIRYSSDNGLYSGHGDYELRWRKAGDEAFTNVPSVPLVANVNRDNFYRFSSTLVEKGDHIRLNDVNISYLFGKQMTSRLHVKNLEFYMYLNNAGILWKATERDLDPDYPLAVSPPSRSIAFGLRAGL